MQQQRCTPGKLELHFPRDRFNKTRERWSKWIQLLSKGIERIETCTMHEDISLHRSCCHEWFKQADGLYKNPLPLVAKNALRDGCRSALAELKISSSCQKEDIWSLRSELYPLLNLKRGFNEKEFGLRVMWSAIRELSQIDYVSIPSFRKKLHEAIKNNCLRELESVFDQSAQQ